MCSQSLSLTTNSSPRASLPSTCALLQPFATNIYKNRLGIHRNLGWTEHSAPELCCWPSYFDWSPLIHNFSLFFCLGYKFLWDILLLVCFISVIFSSFPLPSKIQVVRFKRCAVVCCADWAAEPRHFWQWWPPLPPTRPLSKSSLSTESGWPTSSRQGLKSDLYLWQWWSWCLCFIFDPKCCPPACWSNQWQFKMWYYKIQISYDHHSCDLQQVF